jgi:predicted acetyltransferase
MKIEIIESTKIGEDLSRELAKRVQREFGHVEIVKTHKWAEPTWSFLGWKNDEVVSFLNIIDRQGQVDGKQVQLLGLNNVITEPNHRGKGYSKKLNLAALDFMSKQNPDGLGVLFCADNLMPFYSSLGWEKFSGKTIVWQPSGEKVWPSNCMTYSFGAMAPLGEINLKGLPW